MSCKRLAPSRPCTRCGTNIGLELRTRNRCLRGANAIDTDALCVCRCYWF